MRVASTLLHPPAGGFAWSGREDWRLPLTGMAWATATALTWLISPRLVPLLLVAPAAGLAIARSRRDAAALITAFIAALFVVPSQLVIPGMGASGRPAVIVGLLGLVAVVGAAIIPGETPTGRQPLRIALVALGISGLSSYVVAFTRVIQPVEVRAAERGLLVLAGAIGVAALAAEGLDTRERIEAVLYRLVWAATALAGLGIVQFSTGFDVAARLPIPFLVPNNDLGFIGARSIFRRVAGTSLHPIEFGVVLAVILPIALHFAIHREDLDRVRRFLPPIAIATAALMSVSRSAALAMFVAVAMLVPAWDKTTRHRAAVAAAVFTVLMRLAIPGLLGTFRSMFMNLTSDPSYTGRTDDYDVVGEFLATSPIFGRGIYTFFPELYTTLDNQFLLTTIDMGIVGLLALCSVFVIGASLARGARRRSLDPSIRHLGQALAASILASMATFATYDALSFPQATGVLFLVVGVAGALWRLQMSNHDVSDGARRHRQFQR